MKKLLIIIDGMDDDPHHALGNLTPAHFAYMPALQHMRENVPKDLCTRSWFEALGYGLEVKDRDFCLRCNLISHHDGILTSHYGSEVSPRQCHEIIDMLNNQYCSEKIKFIDCGNFRNLLIVHETEASIKAEAPDEVSHIIDT